MQPLGLTVAQLVRNELPAGFVVSDDYIANNVKINQMLVYKQAGVSEDDRFDETKYTDEWNLLISYLILYNVLQRAFTGNILIGFGASADGSTEGAGVVKKIVTGPAEVEYQDTMAAFSTLIKNLQTDPGSVWSILTTNACALGRLLQIKVPFCRSTATISTFVKAGVQYCLEDYLRLTYAECYPCKPASVG